MAGNLAGQFNACQFNKEWGMNRAFSSFCAIALFLSTSAACFADLQYTEQSKITGGVAVGAMKFVGVFSKDARQATNGMTSTISFKGNKMRRESSNGQAEIYDLDGKRIINMDLKHKTYSVVTFDEMRAQIEEGKRKAAEEQAKKKGGNSQVKITPKIAITPGSGSRQMLNYTAKEMKTRVDMEMQGQDEKGANQSGNMWVNSDAYIAPVKGYEEMKKFYMKMAKELDWLPGAMFGGNTQISQPMVEYRKSAAALNGMPLLSYVSVGMGPNPGTTGQAAAQANPSPEKKEGNAISKGLGGMLGGFGKKNKNDSAAQNTSASGQPSSSLMDMTSEVTSISNSSVDASLFEVPTDFKQIEAKKGQVQ
jgi:hypothetical protein